MITDASKNELSEVSRLIKDRRAGFTLIEVMVALLVLALALAALQLRISQQLDSAAYLRDKTIAQWVALNQLELLRISTRLGNTPPQAAMTGTAQMAGRTWYWELTQQLATTVESVAHSPLPITITVSAQNSLAVNSSPLVSITGVTDGR